MTSKDLFPCAALDGSGATCGELCTPLDMTMMHLPLCTEHLWELDEYIEFVGKMHGREFSFGAIRLGFDDKYFSELPSVPEEPQSGPRSYVYFMQRLSDNCVKIGFSTDPKQRRHDLEVGAGPLHVLAIIEGTRRLEQELHNQFRDWRVHGEWFSPAPPLMEYIESLSEIKSSVH